MNGFLPELEAQLHAAAQAETESSRARLRLSWARVRAKARVVPALAALAVAVGVVVAASGVGSHAHRGRTESRGVAVTPPGSITTATAATSSSGPPDCEAAGINAQLLREGTCLQNAMTLVVVNRASTLHLKSLDAVYRGFHTAGQSAIATITIKNKLGRPQQWQHTQAALFIPGSSAPGSHPFYLENLDAETGDRNSCLWKTGTAANGGLQPGRSVTCDVVVEIPAGADPAATGSGLYIANFGDDVSNASQPVGIIRTYH